MATQLFTTGGNSPNGDNITNPLAAYAGGSSVPKIVSGYDLEVFPSGYLIGTRGSGYSIAQQATQQAATAIDKEQTFWTPPLSADATISGTITFNVWCNESSMSANAAVGVRVFKADATTGVITEFCRSLNGTEMGTTAAAQSWTATPTSTSLVAGDRLGLQFYYGPGGGTMASGYQMYIYYSAASAGAQGDTWISFTENLTFATGYSAGGTRLLCTGDNWRFLDGELTYDLATSASGATGSSNNQQFNAYNGFQAHARFVSGPLAAVTLGPYMWFRLPIKNANYNGGMAAAQVARVDSDGVSNPVVLGYGGWGNLANGENFLSTTWGVSTFAVALRPNSTIADGQRLRIRIGVDDGAYPTNSTESSQMSWGVSDVSTPYSFAYVDTGVTLSAYVAPSSGPAYVGGGYYG